jgi:hypothetical protein
VGSGEKKCQRLEDWWWDLIASSRSISEFASGGTISDLPPPPFRGQSLDSRRTGGGGSGGGGGKEWGGANQGGIRYPASRF